MGKKSRTKGASYEREVANILRVLFPEARRNLDQVREKEGRDLDGTDPLCVQCKRRKKVTIGVIESGLKEAAESVDTVHSFPVVTHRSDGQSSRITMSLSSFLALLLYLTSGGSLASLRDSNMKFDSTDTPSDAGEAHPYLKKWYESGGW